MAAVAFGAGVWMRGTNSPDGQAHTSDAAEALYAITLPDLKGQQQGLAQWRGEVLVVNFWATWCAPCREEIPAFVKLQDKYRANGLRFVGISIDQADKTAEFAAEFKMNYPVLIGSFDTVEVSRQAGNRRRALPFTVVLDRKGRVAATELGGLTMEKLETIVKPLL